ncbi:O-antigen polysaccharide polymerase Wzy [Burkholderia pseudomultivorans]|nr:O-antigen polysaccharide polymerase Wzy [Burkholderia pseudomultivorans]
MWGGLGIVLVAQYLLCLAGLEISDFGYSVEIVIMIILTGFSVRAIGGNYASLYLLFSSSFFLFICGRFIALFLGYESDEGAFDLNWMTSYVANESARNMTFLYLALFVCSFNFFYFVRDYAHGFKGGVLKVNVPLIFLFVILFSIIQIARSAGTLIVALQKGYEAIYTSQAGEYSAGSATLSIFFFVSVSLAFTTDRKWLRRLAIGLLILSAVLSLMAGARGGFVSMLLLLIWLYGRNRSVNFKKVLLFFLCVGGGLALAMQFSARGGGHENLSAVQVPLAFIYSQGVSLGVFSYSQTISAFPLPAYFQSLFPGALFFLNLASNGVNLHDANFQNFLSWTADPGKYELGFGLGWTLLSDLYVYSEGFLPIFIIFSGLCGAGLRWLDDRSLTSSMWAAVCVGLSSKLFMLPRSSISTIISFMVYFVIFYVLVRLGGGRGRRI